MKEIGKGDRLISVTTPDGVRWQVRTFVQSITVGELPGPMGIYLTAQIQFGDQRPDIVTPLHLAHQFEIQFGD